MIGIILIYFIGKYFYNLAEEFSKNKWLYGILGVIVYYAGTFVAGLIFGILGELGIVEGINSINSIFLSLLALPFGILACWLFYIILKKQWSKNKSTNKSEALDGDIL